MGIEVSQPIKRVGLVVTLAFNTQYAALTDGYIKAYDTNIGGEAANPMELLCDIGDPPTLLRDQYMNTDGFGLGGVSFLVAKGENWRVNWGYTGVVLWRPLVP